MGVSDGYEREKEFTEFRDTLLTSPWFKLARTLMTPARMLKY